jgi:hypothetical protein
VREVVSMRPDADGIDDQTAFMGSRLVSANIIALAGAAGRVDEIAAAFGPYMVPAARPTLHYVLDRGTNPERTLRLRAKAYSWPIAGADDRAIQLQWVAADPIAYGTETNTVTSWSGPADVVGRLYPLTYDRAYAAGGGAPASGLIVGPGDVPILPYLRIYGPASAPVVTFDIDDGTGGPAGVAVIPFVSSFRIDAGDFVGVDTKEHRARLNDDPAASVLSALDWPDLVWPVLPNAPATTTMQLTADNATGLTQVVATWTDGYLS